MRELEVLSTAGHGSPRWFRDRHPPAADEAWHENGTDLSVGTFDTTCHMRQDDGEPTYSAEVARPRSRRMCDMMIDHRNPARARSH